MKKIILLILFCLLVISTGCNKTSDKTILKEFKKNIEDSKSYKVTGELEILNNENIYTYKVESAYKSKENYRVTLKNKANNHEQIILKNNDGVYVLTPALNKSFKFQSDWPNNNSQIYLLNSILKDLTSDKKYSFTENDDKYIFTTNVNYPNNPKLVKQNIVFDKNNNLKEVSVLDENDIVQMKMVFKEIKFNEAFDGDYFSINSIMTNSTIETEETGELDDIIFPLYLPTGTKLTNQEKIEKTSGERVILTFDGEKSFTLVEETVDISDELSIIPTFGEPFLLSDTIASLTDNSISWTSAGIDYYLISDVLSQTELIEIARSVTVIPTMK